MPNPPAATNAAAPAPDADKNAAPPTPWPFPVGVYEGLIQDYDETVTQTTSAVQAPIWNISPTGWCGGVYMDFAMAVTGQSTNSVSYSGDDPFSVIQQVTLYDIGSTIIMQFGGYDWMTINKFGGYRNVGDPRADVTYSATTGTGSTAGTFHFNLFLPFEFVHRDAIGTVQNESKPGWRIELYVDAQSKTYNQVPSVMGSLRIRGYIDTYTEPQAGTQGGRPFALTPPVPGTIQYWRTENDGLSSGSNTYDLTNGIGFPLRNVFYKLIDSSTPTRAAGDADWPDPVQLVYGNVTLKNVSKNVLLSELGRDFGLTSATADTALGRENGVFPVYFTKDFTLQPGAEVRTKYLQTQTNDLVRLIGSFGAACTLNALVNWINTPSQNGYSLIAGAGR